MTLRDLRTTYGLTQSDAANALHTPIRTYRRYESDESYGSEMKRNAFKKALHDQYEITEERGLLTVERIKDQLTELFDATYSNQIDFCYLFGSYATGLAKENSDVDLYIVSSLKGLDFIGLIEDVRKTLHKKVDIIRSSELQENVELANEIMKKGIKIYG